MKAYKVEIEKLSFEWGRHIGWEVIGYYANKEKAEKIASDAYENRCKYVEGEVNISEIEIDIED